MQRNTRNSRRSGRTRASTTTRGGGGCVVGARMTHRVERTKNAKHSTGAASVGHAVYGQPQFAAGPGHLNGLTRPAWRSPTIYEMLVRYLVLETGKIVHFIRGLKISRNSGNLSFGRLSRLNWVGRAA